LGLLALLGDGYVADTAAMTLPGDDDLDFVRRQLDDLSLSRAMGTMTDSDRIRYLFLCEREQLLLGLPRKPVMA
jgi:hypothetical protein